jgi:hypothetical protein
MLILDMANGVCRSSDSSMGRGSGIISGFEIPLRRRMDFLC